MPVVLDPGVFDKSRSEFQLEMRKYLKAFRQLAGTREVGFVAAKGVKVDNARVAVFLPFLKPDEVTHWHGVVKARGSAGLVIGKCKIGKSPDKKTNQISITSIRSGGSPDKVIELVSDAMTAINKAEKYVVRDAHAKDAGADPNQQGAANLSAAEAKSVDALISDVQSAALDELADHIPQLARELGLSEAEIAQHIAALPADKFAAALVEALPAH